MLIIHRIGPRVSSSKHAASSMALGLAMLTSGCFDPSIDVIDDGSSSDGSSTAQTDADTYEPNTSESGEPGPVCGDGIVNALGEQCDDGAESAFCNEDCTVAICGDGILNETAGEECDAGGPTAECDGDCTMAQCGDLHVNAAAGEECEGDELAGGTCEGLGFDAGTLLCGAGCVYDVSECELLPGVPVLNLSVSQVKRFDFSWAPAPGAEYYQLLESRAPGEPLALLGGDIVGQSASFEMPLHFRFEASYVLQACNALGCTEAVAVDVMGAVEQAVGYFKASNPSPNDTFGFSVTMSGDGNTLAVGARLEDSNAMGIDGDQTDDSMHNAGAVYVFTRDVRGGWTQQAYVKASNTGWLDYFGRAVALSTDGNTLAVGAVYEDSLATGIGGDQGDDSAQYAGAVYVFTRDGMGSWSQQAYVKASNTGVEDRFGFSVALSGDGGTLAVGADWEDSAATGIGGEQADDSAANAGAVYVFVRDGMGDWSQQAYVKASNTDPDDRFGISVALSGSGDTLAVGADREDGGASGIDGDEADDTASSAGAVYVFVRDGMGTWSQQAYVKASNPDPGDRFGASVALDVAGDTLAIGAFGEDSNTTGIDGIQTNDSAPDAGAAYVFVRDGTSGWSQQAYVKASNTDPEDYFGQSIALGASGDVLAVGACLEDSSSTGIGGNQMDDSVQDAGAAYVFVRDEMGAWSQKTYVKAPNTGVNDQLGYAVALSADGNTLAVSAHVEDSSALGIGGDQADGSSEDAGAVYLY